MLVHILTSWDGGDVPRGPDGFVHLSRVDQVAGTIQRHYCGTSRLILLVVDEGALPRGALRFEDAAGHGSYPHLYDTLPAAAVIRVVPWRIGDPIDL